MIHDRQFEGSRGPGTQVRTIAQRGIPLRYGAVRARKLRDQLPATRAWIPPALRAQTPATGGDLCGRGGSARVKLDDEVLELKRWDAVRVPPRTVRQFEAGSEGAEILAFGAPHTGASVAADAEPLPDWWTG
jgi:hypothetical protein